MDQQSPSQAFVQQVLAQRAGQNGPSPAPLLNTQLQPTGTTPTGGPNTPTVPPAPLPTPAPTAAPQQNLSPAPGAEDPTQLNANKLIKTAVNTLNPGLDSDTQALTKQLIVRLLNYH